MELRRCLPSDLQTVVDLNETVYAALPDKSILRHNSPEMIASCLEEPNVTLGMWDGDVLVAIGMLYVPQCIEEDHFHDLGLQGDYKSANQKLFLVREGYRGLGLQRQLIREVEHIALARGYNLLCTTVAPNNTYSINNFLKEGYVYAKTEEKYGGLLRNLYYKPLAFSH
jgi:GNAT superfamily N-acetyltransferase